METINNISKTQVVIVGAGPTGLSLASQLIRYGVDFIILEKNEKTTLLSKALVIQARTLEIFDELGIVRDAISEGQVTTALNLFYKGKQKAFVNIEGIGNGLSAFPFALSLEQSKTEQILVKHIAENKHEIKWGSDFTHFVQSEKEVIVYYKNSIGAEQKIEADYLVGCDGAGSTIRHQMGLSFEGDTIPKLFYVADVVLKSPVINKHELFMFMITKGFILFFPMEGIGHYRIIGVLPESNGEDLQFSDIENYIINQVDVPLAFEAIGWFSSYKVHSRKANYFENGRCYIAGDAAHIHTPAGGQGMNTGIQDAYNLAWKMAFTIKGKVKANVLSTYNIERSENAKHLLHTTDKMFDIMAGANLFLNFIRLHIFSKIAGLVLKSETIKKRIFPLLSQTGITYSSNCLTLDSSIGKIKSGVRMPYFVFANGKQVFDYLSEPAFKILFFGSDVKYVGLKPELEKINLIAHIFKEIPTSIFGSQTNFYILLRPDNHISYIGKDINKCRLLLNGIISNSL